MIKIFRNILAISLVAVLPLGCGAVVAPGCRNNLPGCRNNLPGCRNNLPGCLMRTISPS